MASESVKIERIEEEIFKLAMEAVREEGRHGDLEIYFEIAVAGEYDDYEGDMVELYDRLIDKIDFDNISNRIDETIAFEKDPLGSIGMDEKDYL